VRALNVAAGTALALLGLTGCAAEPAPGPTGRASLSVHTVSYDCATHELTVKGQAGPAREAQQVQVQVRSVDHPTAPVWRIAATDPRGNFVARGRYLVNAGDSVDLNVKLASVVAGERVFSAKTAHPVTCK
jgi:hypothetical protein